MEYGVENISVILFIGFLSYDTLMTQFLATPLFGLDLSSRQHGHERNFVPRINFSLVLR